MNISNLKPKQRFSHLVNDYSKYRPDYPEEIIQVLRNEFDLNASSVIADIGSGTGKLSSLFIKNGNKTFAIEPNKKMRKESERLFKNSKHFISINGSAENTKLKDSSIDFIVVGQAFHWFNRDITKIEFNRILKKDGIIVLIWNKRDNTINIMKEYEEIVKRNCTEYRDISHHLYNEKDIISFYKPLTAKKYIFSNIQIFDFLGLLGRIKSTSYCPKENTRYYRMLIDELEKLFLKYKQSEKIEFKYNTIMYVSNIS